MFADVPAPDGGRRVERRRPKPPGQSPIDDLQRMPALVALERLPTPALAVDRAGTVLFANGPFCRMTGYLAGELQSMSFDEFFVTLPADDTWIVLAGTSAQRRVVLRHKDGHSVWASMSKSAMRRRDDTVALVTFHDRTEELWLNSVDPDRA
ncbi:PAS domain S-box protein [Mycobacterium bohemicum]|nr:PAS domain-containing protein [Mycobacterium bohemicum]